MRPQRTHLEVVLAHVQLDGSTVVDVGCGTGTFTRRLAAEGARLIGVDPSATAIAHAVARAGTRERYVLGAAEQLPVADGSADTVAFLNSLHHVRSTSLTQALIEACRVLRPSGLVYVQEPLAEGPYYEIVRLVDDEQHVREAAQRALRNAEPAGLRPAAEVEYDAPVRHRDFRSFRNAVLLADERRATAFAARSEDLQARFYNDGEQVTDGWRFLQPTRVTILRPAETECCRRP